MAANIVLGATVTVYADSEYSASYPKAYAIDSSIATYWASLDTDFPHWLAIDLGEGITKKATRAYITTETNGGGHLGAFEIQGSNNSTNGEDGDWDSLFSGTHLNNDYLQDYNWVNNTEYRWYRIYVTSSYRSKLAGIKFLQLFEEESCPVMPFMTSNNMPPPYAVSVNYSLHNSLHTEPFHAFDNDFSTILVSDKKTSSGIVKIDFGEGNAKVANGYSLMPTPGETDRMCSIWTLEGSNNDIDWEVLDSQQGITSWVNRTVKEFDFSNNIEYRYYRLNITENNGDTYRLQIGWIQLLGSAGTEPEPPASEGIFFATFI